MHLGLIGDLLSLGLGGIGDFTGLALGLGHRAGRLLTHVGELLIRLGERLLNLIVGFALQMRDLFVRSLALSRNLLRGVGLHVGDLTVLLGQIGGHTLLLLFTGVAQLKLDGIALLGDGLGSFGTHLRDLFLRVRGDRRSFGIRLVQRGLRLRIRLVGDVLGVELRVVQQGFSLRLG